MRKGSVPLALIFAVVGVFLAARALPLLAPPTDTERLHAGAGRHLVLFGDARPDAFRADAPLATLLASLPLFATTTPSEEWDERGPPDQTGWIALYETRPAADTPPFAPGTTVLLTRLPFVLLNGLALLLLLRLATRFYEAPAALFAGLLVAASAGLAVAATRATPLGLAPAATIVLLATFDDHARTLHHPGHLPNGLARRRALACGGAVGLCLATSVAFLPVVGAALVWLALRRSAARRRQEPLQKGAAARLALGVVAAALVLWLADAARLLRPFVGPDDPAALDRLGLPAAALWPALPAATWLGALLHGIADAGLPDAARSGAAWEGGGALLAVLFLIAVPAWHDLRRDRIDLPALLVTLGLAAALTSLGAAPRHSVVATTVAVIPLAVLAGAWLLRLWRHARARCLVVGALLASACGLGWTDAAGEAGAPPVHAAESAPSPTETWLLQRYLASHAPGVVHTVLGRPGGLRMTGSVHVVEHPPDDPALRDIARGLDAGEPVAVVVGTWLAGAGRTVDELMGAREPSERLGRLVVFTARH